MLDGIAWIFYYQSLTYGPISIVGTLSAAYPALTVIFARYFLGEDLTAMQGLGVAAVLAGCLALAWSPPDSSEADERTLEALRRRRARHLGRERHADPLRVQLPGRARGEPRALHRDRRADDARPVWCCCKAPRAARRAPSVVRSAGPMATMALGSLLVAIAYKHGPASLVTPLAGAYPVVTIAFAWAVLKERPTRLQWGGIVAVLVGMVLTTAVATA